MTPDENAKIATLTTDAIKSTTAAAIKAMEAAVDAAEEKVKEMRTALEQYAAEFEQSTSSLAETVTAHVGTCQVAIDSFQALHLKILHPDGAPAKLNGQPTHLHDALEAVASEIGKLQSAAPSPVDGRR
jgi:phage shock protein A